jgi:hypothetical protein
VAFNLILQVSKLENKSDFIGENWQETRAKSSGMINLAA